MIKELNTEEMKAIPEINMLLQEALIRNCRPSRSSALALEKGKPRSMNSVGEKVFSLHENVVCLKECNSFFF